ncbi:rhodanese-like domain-containing protein [Streptomyces sp. NBC_00102]|uniref:rhodanese-like domain-containing protein n=1 Tax=Streptomyces sp. NBC_00102 TaxID=2975652 RepID=UPI00225A0087|nr:rhodanese-like domain-containing protein [Streptomyces sp. NBC_00102]MCX5401981.1 rhodanese-like domain-containing protein [Streptomyces sp. NBC_00102]
MPLFRRGTARVTPVQAHRRTTDGDAVLLDVRERIEWVAGHAPGAVHVPLSRLITGEAPPAAEGRPLMVICRSGHRSQQAVKLLNERGAGAVDVKGGMNAWASAGLPVVDDRGSHGRTP